MINDEIIIELFYKYDKLEFHQWEITYIQDEEIRTTYYRSKDMFEALNWLKEVTDNKANAIQILETHILEEINDSNR